MALLESELVSKGIVPESGDRGELLKIPTLKKLLLKIEKIEKAHRYADLARQIALLQKNQEKLWNCLVEVGKKLGVAIVEH